MVVLSLSPVAWRRSANDLATLWMALTASLSFLDVSIRDSALLSGQIVLHSAIGCVFLMRVTPMIAPSLLVLLGPGLAIGGPLSLLVFQVAGRGAFGAVVTSLLGLLATFRICTIPQLEPANLKRPALFAYLFGLVALAMSSGFIWLFSVACSLLICGYSMTSEFNRVARIRLLTVVSTLATLLLARHFRSSSWWLITDDVVFLETLSQHITRSGPHADWGAISFLKYHWLSYGWAGVLDFTAGGLAPLVTLTRVMPLVYSLIFVSSLLLLARNISKLNLVSPEVIFTVCAVVLSYRLDWSGMSTAGQLAVLAAVIAVMSEVLDSSITWRIRFGLYSIVALVVGLTKFPSVIALLPLIVGTELLFHLRLKQKRTQLTVAACAVALTGVFLILVLPNISRIIGGFSIVWSKDRGDDLSQRGLFVQLSTLFGRRAGEISVIAISWLILLRERTSRVSATDTLLLSLAPLLVIGVIMEASINGYANTISYFSDPNFFLSGVVVVLLLRLVQHREITGGTTISLLFFFTLGLSILSEIAHNNATTTIKVGRLIFGMASHYDAAVLCIIAGGIFAVKWNTTQRFRSETLVHLSLLMALSAMVAGGVIGKPTLLWQAVKSRHLNSVATELYLGSPDAKLVGEWISLNVPESAVIGTNHLQNSGGYLSDYSLAMWSRREFLVLGPRLFNIELTQAELIELSLRFGSSPSISDLQLLSEYGVEWFVVNVTASPIRNWTVYGTTMFRTSEFWVLKLKSPATKSSTEFKCCYL